MTKNLSRGGFAFLHKAYIRPGTLVGTQLEGVPGRPQIDGIVCHCHLVKGTTHLVGVEFLEGTGLGPGSSKA